MLILPIGNLMGRNSEEPVFKESLHARCRAMAVPRNDGAIKEATRCSLPMCMNFDAYLWGQEINHAPIRSSSL